MSSGRSPTASFPVAPPLTYQDFADFLESLASDTPVGLACSSYTCPLQQYLSTILPSGLVTTVSTQTYTVSTAHAMESTFTPLPRWAQQFVYNLDCRYQFQEQRTVSAGECLEVLRGIEP